MVEIPLGKQLSWRKGQANRRVPTSPASTSLSTAVLREKILSFCGSFKALVVGAFASVTTNTYGLQWNNKLVLFGTNCSETTSSYIIDTTWYKLVCQSLRIGRPPR